MKLRSKFELARFAAMLNIVLVSVLLISACSSVPLTGRRQINIIPSNELHAMSFDMYNQIKDTARVIRGTADARMVERCGKRIQKAVEEYFSAQNNSQLLAGFEWEFILIDDPAVNAWCMPGGKVAFYTGILPYTKNEVGLAVVMGHEIAHAVARHGGERMSQAMVAQMGALGLGVALRDKRQETQALFMGAYGIGVQLGGMLPFSRKHESEADELGLYFMAMAGYDPREAPIFWERMSQAGGGDVPEFISTHPSHSTRIRQLESYMPKALGYFQN